MRARVLAARGRAEARLGHSRANGAMTPREVRRHARLSAEPQALLERAARRFQLSARSLDRTLRVARTLADLAGSERVETGHVAEAVRLSAGEGRV